MHIASTSGKGVITGSIFVMHRGAVVLLTGDLSRCSCATSLESAAGTIAGSQPPALAAKDVPMKRANSRARVVWNVATLALALLGLGPRATFGNEPGDRSPTASPTAVEAAMRHDATLADVFFVDAMTGWAVGDRGVV
jgi:hypothetical protein